MKFAAGYVGNSADHLKIRRFEKEREERRKQLEELKKKSNLSIENVGTRQFSPSICSILELRFGEETMGLVTKEEFKKKRQNLEIEEYQNRVKEISHRNRVQENQRKHEEEIAKSKLSFLATNDKEHQSFTSTNKKFHENFFEFGDQENVSTDIGSSFKRSKLIKNPDVDTSFLPDKTRNKEEERERKKVERRLRIFQNESNNEYIDIVYSYWNGSAHRRKIVVSKGHTIEHFLSAVQKQLASDFKKLRSTSSASLMYVKEGIIIPHQLTFHELILSKAKSKTSPLFDFRIQEEIRVGHSTFRERDESREGKVVEREWYENNKKTFPANRWEKYDLNSKNCPSI
jgi:protein FAM50